MMGFVSFTFAMIIRDNTGDQLESVLICPMRGIDAQDGGGMFLIDFPLKLGL